MLFQMRIDKTLPSFGCVLSFAQSPTAPPYFEFTASSPSADLSCIKSFSSATVQPKLPPPLSRPSFRAPSSAKAPEEFAGIIDVCYDTVNDAKHGDQQWTELKITVMASIVVVPLWRSVWCPTVTYGPIATIFDVTKEYMQKYKVIHTHTMCNLFFRY